MTIQIKRAYAPPERRDGVRLLVDHFWPRGVSKEALQVERWGKAVAPSDELRSWFGHQPARWDAFQQRYAAELDAHPQDWTPLLDLARKKDVTLVFSARDLEHNNAVALKRYLDRKHAGPAHSKRATSQS